MLKIFQATVLTSAGCLWVIDQKNKGDKTQKHIELYDNTGLGKMLRKLWGSFKCAGVSA